MKSIRILWRDLVPHVHLQEYVRFDGLDTENETFWLILLPTTLHNLHLVAYSYAGVAARAQAGALGVTSLKPGGWSQLVLTRPRHVPVAVLAEVLAGEPDWATFPKQAVALGNIVDYVQGNALCVQARAGQLESRFIKHWDIPVAYAFTSGRAASAAHGDLADVALRANEADAAKFSQASNLASVAVEAQVARVSDQAGAAAGGAAGEPQEPGQPARLRLGKVHVLGEDAATSLDFRVEYPVCIRVFNPPGETIDAGKREQLAEQLRSECLMHMRLHAAKPSASQSCHRLLLVYQDAATPEFRVEDLCERNVIGMARLEDGRVLDAVKISEVGPPPGPAGAWLVRVLSLAHQEGLRVAVWVVDPLTPALSFGGQLGAGRYKLIRCAGAGGMGVVWLAQDLRLGEQVALKFLPPEIRTDPVALDDLRREALRCRKLTHPHIVRIHDLVEAPGEPAFVSMEYVEGPTFTELRLAQPHGVLSWDVLAPLICELGSALAYAHGEKVIHHDLKPSNVMLDARGRVKLTDFGISASLSESLSSSTYGRRIRGTLAYMSPQQIEGGRPCPEDDLYALGATLYELLTSRPPFFSGDLLYQTLSVLPTPLEARLAELGLRNPIPAPAATTILACLAKEPEQRPRTVKAALSAMGLGADQTV